MTIRLLLAIAIAIGSPIALVGQSTGTDITGTWRVAGGADVGNGPREVVIRADSSASWGKEMVRWRVAGDRIAIAIGGEWERYKLSVKGNNLTLSGGDLRKPVTLRRTGPPTARPNGVRVPDDPDARR
ncbi:MAG: hypothetical protein H0W15_10440 [Gemmatimonadales bacterium]|nr:hypothetical protein [Gemmatimonadales bacterium]